MVHCVICAACFVSVTSTVVRCSRYWQENTNLLYTALSLLHLS